MLKSNRVFGLVVTLMGALLLLNNLGNPRIEALHVPDVLKLVASGGLLAIGLFGLFGRLKE
jgi:hypothetical protein